VTASALLCPASLAAALLVGRGIAEEHGLVRPEVDAILAATGASKSQAYELAGRLRAALPALARAPGRPTKEKEQPAVPLDCAGEMTRAVLAYVMEHPGCVDRGSERKRYSSSFRRFVLRLRVDHASLSVERFADAAGVPLGTLKDWLREPTCDGEAMAADAEPVATTETPASEPAAADVQALQLQTVIHAWSRWDGSFLDFCQHVQRDLDVPFGRDFVRHILAVHCGRAPSRRAGRGPDELALRGAFRTWFPGAQWVGDGMTVPVVVDGQRFVFNLELDVDACSGAFVGVSVRDNEDSAAVVEAFSSGVETTGAAPLALLLDNKPSNHAPEVDAALGNTLRMRATLERPQNKAHVEGAFGLFSQVLPPLVLDTHQRSRNLARGFLGLVAEVWARATNHRPRKDRGGRSRVDPYSATPTAEQIEQARHALRDLAERQEQARRTREARCRPEVLALLDEHFAHLKLLDPERHVRIAIAAYPLNAIISAISIFDAKRCAKRLPDGVDARYLLGIVKNVTAQTELELFAEILYRNRVEMRDRILASRRAERDALKADPDVSRVLESFVERAAESPAGGLQRTFWLDAIIELLREREAAERERHFEHVARLVGASFTLTPRERQDAVRYIADRLVPIE
jgi:hypothetical protein